MPICCGKKDNYIEEQAWHVTANDVFTGVLLSMIAEILVQMMHRRSTGLKLDDQDYEFLREILEEKENKEGMAGTMANVAAPKEKTETKKQDQKGKAEEANGRRDGHLHGESHVPR